MDSSMIVRLVSYLTSMPRYVTSTISLRCYMCQTHTNHPTPLTTHKFHLTSQESVLLISLLLWLTRAGPPNLTWTNPRNLTWTNPTHLTQTNSTHHMGHLTQTNPRHCDFSIPKPIPITLPPLTSSLYHHQFSPTVSVTHTRRHHHNSIEFHIPIIPSPFSPITPSPFPQTMKSRLLHNLMQTNSCKPYVDRAEAGTLLITSTTPFRQGLAQTIDAIRHTNAKLRFTRGWGGF
jgi:hypothetical protein